MDEIRNIILKLIIKMKITRKKVDIYIYLPYGIYQDLTQIRFFHGRFLKTAKVSININKKREMCGITFSYTKKLPKENPSASNFLNPRLK